MTPPPKQKSNNNIRHESSFLAVVCSTASLLGWQVGPSSLTPKRLIVSRLVFCCEEFHQSHNASVYVRRNPGGPSSEEAFQKHLWKKSLSPVSCKIQLTFWIFWKSKWHLNASCKGATGHVFYFPPSDSCKEMYSCANQNRPNMSKRTTSTEKDSQQVNTHYQECSGSMSIVSKIKIRPSNPLVFLKCLDLWQLIQRNTPLLRLFLQGTHHGTRYQVLTPREDMDEQHRCA